MDENLNDNMNDNLSENLRSKINNLKPAQKAILTQYTAELEGEMTKCWAKVCEDYNLGLEEDYENLPYACFACGFLDGAKLTQIKLMSFFGLNK